MTEELSGSKGSPYVAENVENSNMTNDVVVNAANYIFGLKRQVWHDKRDHGVFYRTKIQSDLHTLVEKHPLIQSKMNRF